MPEILETRLTVLSHAGVRDGHRMILVRCTCGTERIVRAEAVRRGRIRSCGCLFTDTHTTHGRSTRKPENKAYRSWEQMISRCLNQNNHAYADYGGMGIKVCERWLNSFSAFLVDVGEPPTIQHSIDRFPDCDGNYEPGNCRWATRKEQNNNKRANRFITHNGQRKTFAQWAELLGVNKSTFYSRIRKHGVASAIARWFPGETTDA